MTRSELQFYALNVLIGYLFLYIGKSKLS